MGAKPLVFTLALLICFFVLSIPLVAQSKDRNNPAPLLSPEIKAFNLSHSAIDWYKLTAGPGELVVEMEVECGNNLRCGVSARFILYDKDMQEVMDVSLATTYLQKRSKNKSIRLQNKQDFLLSITHGRTLSGSEPGTYMIRFKGAIDIPSKESE